MELFRNIYDYLLLANPLLISGIMFFAAIIEALFILLTITQISSKNISNKSKYLFILFFTTTSAITLHIIPSPFNVIVNYILFFLLTKLIFKFSYLETLVNIVISSSICLLVGFVVSHFFITVLRIPHEYILTIPIYRFFFLSILYFIYFLILKILWFCKLSVHFKNNLLLKNKLLLFANFTVAMLVLIFQVICIFKNHTSNTHYTNYFFIFCSLLIYVGLNILTLIKVIQLQSTSEKLENAESYNRTLTVLHDNVRGFKHDFDNLIATLGGFVETEDLSGLKDFYKDIANDCRKTNNLYALNPELINNPGIYNLLISKYEQIELNNIKLNLSMQLDFNNLKIKTYHLARIVGVLLDNAIEACKDIDEKIINIEFRTSHRARKHIILIENTYSNRTVDTVSIFKKGFTEKDNHSGIGLWEANEFLRNYDDIILTTSKTNTFFSQQLDFMDF